MIISDSIRLNPNLQIFFKPYEFCIWVNDKRLFLQNISNVTNAKEYLYNLNIFLLYLCVFYRSNEFD